jgi:hypothetical protein
MTSTNSTQKHTARAFSYFGNDVFLRIDRKNTKADYNNKQLEELVGDCIKLRRLVGWIKF